MGWDAGRLVKTVLFFGAIPILSDCTWFARMTGQTGAIAYEPDRTGPTITLLVGDNGPVTQQWTRRLQDRGERFRLVNIAETPAQATEIFAGISRQLPLERISQGISTVVVSSDRPEATAFAKTTIAQIDLSAVPSQTVLFDFRQPFPNLQEIWGAVDDVVMGGVSASGIRMGDGAAVFSGLVSTDNSGGFASVRTRNLQPPLQLSRFDGILLRVKGDGQRYKFLIRDDRQWDGMAYGFSFDTVNNEWIDVRIPFAGLIPVMRAKTVPNVGPVNAASISALQVMLSKFEYDGALNPKFQAGEFRLEIESISAYQNSPSSAVILTPAQTALASWLQQQEIGYRVI